MSFLKNWNYQQGQYSSYWEDHQQDGGEAQSLDPKSNAAPQPQGQESQISDPNPKKRDRSSSPGPDRREKARFRVTDITYGPVNPNGNRLHSDVTWTEQEDDRGLGPPRTQAMWLVKEGGFDTGTNVWWRPAAHFTKDLEAQFQAGIGCQHGEICYEDTILQVRKSSIMLMICVVKTSGSSAAIGMKTGLSLKVRSR